MSDSTVLFVDDEEFVLSSLERFLIQEPFAKRFASTGARALQILEAEPVQVVVTDMQMPHMDGMELLKTVKDRWPETIRIVLSAHVGTPRLLEAINSGEVYRYLVKPLQSPEEVCSVLRDALEIHSLRRARQEMTRQLEERNRQLEKTLAQVRQLQGLLPICASCKKIRDDQGYWQQIEDYIVEHSEAIFSHGLCPTCAHHLYPDLFPAPPSPQSPSPCPPSS